STNPSSTVTPGFPAPGLISASIRPLKLSPSPPTTASSGRARPLDEVSPVSLLRPAGPHLRCRAAGLEPGGPENHRLRPVSHQRRATAVPHHLHLWRCFHRGLRIRRLAPRHLDRLLRFSAACDHGPVYRLASARARLARPAGICQGLRL